MGFRRKSPALGRNEDGSVKRIICSIGAVCGTVGVALSYDPTRDSWDRPYLLVLIPALWLCIFGILDPE